jgi:hypothetical protein
MSCAAFSMAGGVAYGPFEDGKLQATALLRLPSLTRPNTQLTPFPRVPREDWALSAAFLENTIVHPRVRGRGFQHLLIDACFKHARAVRMKWVCSGVHLKNEISWANLHNAALTEGCIGVRLTGDTVVYQRLRTTDAVA